MYANISENHPLDVANTFNHSRINGNYLDRRRTFLCIYSKSHTI